MRILGNTTQSDFLKQYWQKKPLLIRQAFPDITSPISPEELAGLACEEGIESRLIQEQGAESPWELRYGPFEEEDFTSLPQTHWSLLVQALDHHLPELSQLLDEFNFIPNWRVDDVMVSFAPEGGSVGPHLDNYDVFLLQVQGRRHWHINEGNYSENDFIEGLDLKILSEFESQEDWILEPGDMLYLPPGVAHHGIALDNCLTYSIGFRAPSQKELLSAYTVSFNEHAKDTFYSDPDLKLQDASGEIKSDDIHSLQNMLLSAISNKTEFANWFGHFITNNLDELEPEYDLLDEPTFINTLKQASHLNRYGNIRFSYINNNDSVTLFYSGQSVLLPNSQLSLITYLCSSHRLDCSELRGFDDKDLTSDLLYTLYSAGCFYFDE